MTVPVQTDGARRRAALWAGGILIVIFGIWVFDRSSTPTAYVPPADASSATATPFGAPAAVPPAADAQVPVVSDTSIHEERPEVGIETLTTNQIAYCLAENVRMTAAQARVSTSVPTQVAAFNRYVSDFNPRCGRYRYAQADMSQAQEYVEAHRQALAEEGAARIPTAPADDGAPTAGDDRPML